MKHTQRDSLDSPARLFKALADPVRLRILNLLAGRPEICVCHLGDALALPQPTVSRHLAYLRKNGLVSGRKEGLWVHYRLAKPTSSLHRMVLESLGTCLTDAATFVEDRARLDRVVTICDGL